MTISERSLEKHYEWGGKIEVISRAPVSNSDELSLAYTPGVAEACRQIVREPEDSWRLTRRGNLVAVITDGTAVLGLGDIGSKAAMPVMEGKCCLFKAFADVDAVPVCLDTKDTDELVRTIHLMSNSFGGINLEDISAPRCFEVEARLKQLCDIPVFHDDQHGTAVVLGAALTNALKLKGKRPGEIKVVINGIGAAGSAIAQHLIGMGVTHMLLCDRDGILYEDMPGINFKQRELAKITNPENKRGLLKDELEGADVFIGVSRAGLVTKEMVRSMAEKPVIFPMANPEPEITPEDAKAAGAYIVGTGRSDQPNQINNVLAFPGIFRGALDVRASDINVEMQRAASRAIAELVTDEELSPDYIMPKAFDPRVGKAVAAAVAKAARETGVSRI